MNTGKKRENLQNTNGDPQSTSGDDQSQSNSGDGQSQANSGSDPSQPSQSPM